MWHEGRRWQIKDVETADELADKLTEMTWTLCSGFRFGGHLFLNDSLNEDGAQEYGIVREATGEQIETVTFSWLGSDDESAAAAARRIIRDLTGHAYPAIAMIDVAARVEPALGHRCRWCL